MPVAVRRQNCRDSQGNRGRFVVFETSNGKKKSCHRTRSGAQAAARIRNAAERKSTIKNVENEIQKLTDHFNSCCGE